jgi:hypothetical protein
VLGLGTSRGEAKTLLLLSIAWVCLMTNRVGCLNVAGASTEYF